MSCLLCADINGEPDWLTDCVCVVSRFQGSLLADLWENEGLVSFAFSTQIHHASHFLTSQDPKSDQPYPVPQCCRHSPVWHIYPCLLFLQCPFVLFVSESGRRRIGNLPNCHRSEPAPCHACQGRGSTSAHASAHTALQGRVKAALFYRPGSVLHLGFQDAALLILLPLWVSPAANELHNEVTWEQMRRNLTDVHEQGLAFGRKEHGNKAKGMGYFVFSLCVIFLYYSCF